MKYVLQFGLDKKSQNKIQKIKNYLRLKGLPDKQRGWLPHITLDLYNVDSVDEFIEKVSLIVTNMKSFSFSSSRLGDFKRETLFIDIDSKEKFIEIKNIFDDNLSQFIIEKHQYHPHITICTNNLFSESEKQALKKFKRMKITVSSLWLYDEKVNLIKEWKLSDCKKV